MPRIIDRLGWAIAGALALGLIAVVAGIAGAGPLDPDGPPASTPGVRLPGTPISQPGVSGFPIVIDEAGSYYLVENITGVPGEQGIRITSSDVVLDLNGFTLNGVGGSLSGIAVDGESVIIRNGTVAGWDLNGIDASTGVAVTVMDVMVSQNIKHGLDGAPGSTVTNVVARQNLQAGMIIRRGSTATNVASYENEGDGFVVDFGTTLSDCAATANNGDGIEASTNVEISACVATENQGSGIAIIGTGVTVRDSTASANQHGIRVVLGDGNRIDGNTVAENFISGIFVNTAGNLIIRNSARANTIDNYDIVAGNNVGPEDSSAGGVFDATNPWANINY